MDLAAGRDVKLLDLADSIDGMKKLNPGYTLVTVPADTYPKQTQAVKVIGYATHIVASCKLPEDIVYAMTKTMAQNVDSMAAVNKAIAGLAPKDMAQDIGVPFHEGAAKFYKEAGIDVKMR
jgi:TRAP transporter TAXI family solute receptor